MHSRHTLSGTWTAFLRSSRIMELLCVSHKLEALGTRLSAVEMVNTKLDSLSDQLATQLSYIFNEAAKIDVMAVSGVAGQHLVTCTDVLTVAPTPWGTCPHFYKWLGTGEHRE